MKLVSTVSFSLLLIASALGRAQPRPDRQANKLAPHSSPSPEYERRSVSASNGEKEPRDVEGSPHELNKRQPGNGGEVGGVDPDIPKGGSTGGGTADASKSLISDLVPERILQTTSHRHSSDSYTDLYRVRFEGRFSKDDQWLTAASIPSRLIYEYRRSRNDPMPDSEATIGDPADASRNLISDLVPERLLQTTSHRHAPGTYTTLYRVRFKGRFSKDDQWMTAISIPPRLIYEYRGSRGDPLLDLLE